MASLLESLLSKSTTFTPGTSAPVILSEQHDVSKIDWRAGMADQAEMLKVIGTDENAGVRAGMMRAQLDTTTGKVALMVAGKAAWHKLGVHIESATDSANAIILAGLNWPVDKIPMFYRDSDGTFREQSDVWAIVRRDTGAMLGSVGSRYTPIQNAQGFQFLDSVLGEFGAKYESAGSIYGGRKVFMTVRLPGQDFSVNGSDEVQAYAVLFNPHDGSGVANCFPTSLRPECANTARIAVDRDGSKGIKIRHTGNVATKIESAKQALGLAVKGFDTFRENAELLAKTALPDVRQYVDNVLDTTLEVSAADASRGAELLVDLMRPKDSAERATLEKCIGRKIERRQDFVNDILERYESRTNGINGMRGSAWSAFNAVTEFSDHAKIGKQSRDEHTRLSRRFESALAGEGDDLKQAAFSQALEYATN